MNTSPAMLLIFLALASAAGAILMGLRDLVAARRMAKVAAAPAPAFRLERMPRETESPRGLVAGFDHWFIGLLRDTGTGWEPLAATLLLVLCAFLVGGMLMVWTEHPVLAAVGATAGLLAPLVWFMRRRAARVRQMQEQLPAALDMLARSIRAGQSLDQALDLVGHHSPEPLAREFRFCARQLGMGLSMPAVMRSLVSRVKLYDVRIFTTTLTVHREAGGNLAKVLERLAWVVRDRLSYRRQLRVATGAGRISAILVGAIGPLMFLFFLLFRPEYLQAMLGSPLGQSVLVMAVVLEVIGLVWTARLMKPAY